MDHDFFKYPGYADDICLFFHGIIELSQMTLDLGKDGNIVSLKVKTTVVNPSSLQALLICINGQYIQGVEIVYLCWKHSHQSCGCLTHYQQ